MMITFNKAVLTHKQKGFTLLEVLMAVAIFSVVSLASFTIFDTVLRGEESSAIRSKQQNDMQRAFLLMERDLTQMAKRSMRINGEAASEGYIQTSDDSFLDAEQGIAFVRGGWTNPGLLLPRGDMQSVGYRLEDEKLERLHYNFVDAVVGQEPKIRILLSGVTSLAFEFYDGSKWQEKWSSDKLPQAIAIEIETIDYGLIRRQYLVAGDAASKTNSKT